MKQGWIPLCIWCIWDVKGQLHMTGVSSVSGRRADTLLYLVYLGTPPTCVRLHIPARFLESRIESYNVHAHSTRLLCCSEVNKGCYSEVIQLPFVSSIHFCMIFKFRHMVTFLIWQVVGLPGFQDGAVLGNLGCNRPSEHSLPEHA